MYGQELGLIMADGAVRFQAGGHKGVSAVRGVRSTSIKGAKS